MNKDPILVVSEQDQHLHYSFTEALKFDCCMGYVKVFRFNRGRFEQAHCILTGTSDNYTVTWSKVNEY